MSIKRKIELLMQEIRQATHWSTQNHVDKAWTLIGQLQEPPPPPIVQPEPEIEVPNLKVTWPDDLQAFSYDMCNEAHKAAMRPLLRRIANLERYNAGLAAESCERRQRIEELEKRISKPEMRTFSVSVPVSAIGESGNWSEIARALCDPLAQCVIEELEARIGE